jgi:hypothetical protein
LIHQNKVTTRTYLHDEICKITHTHIDLAHRSSILLHVVIEQAPFLLMAKRLDSWLAMRPQSILNLHFWFVIAIREWREKA